MFTIEKIIIIGSSTKNLLTGTHITFENHIDIPNGCVISNSEKTIIEYEPTKNDEKSKTNYFISNDPKKDVNIIDQRKVNHRKPTKQELDLLNEFHHEELKQINQFCDSEINNEDGFIGNEDSITVFDVTNDFKIIIQSFCTVITNENKEHDVIWGCSKYAIKYNIVYPYHDDDLFDKVEEDISEITKHLNHY